jgi:predicted component of viral defense system (DUF524 family)
MVSFRISRLRFLDESGQELDAPLEWARGLVEIECAPADWEQVVLRRNEVAMPVLVRELEGRVRVLAEWPLSGAGTFELALEFRDGSWSERRACVVAPRKLSALAVEQMVDDLQQRLPASIAIALQRAGALSGINIVPPRETTLAEELHRLTRAIDGTSARAGLVAVLHLLSEHPYQVLRAFEQWTNREQARRVDPSRLAQAFSRAGNLDRDRLPILVPERPVTHSVDTYENRLVKAFHSQVNVRLRHLLIVLKRRESWSLAEEAGLLLARLGTARRAAAFLDDVTELSEPPGRVTMVLLKRPEYRAAFEGFLEFRRRALVRLSQPATDVPLENLPFLYQTWGVLEVIAVLLELGADLGYRIRRERLSSRRAGELWIQLLRDGQPAVILTHPELGRVISLIPQRTYSPGAKGLNSISFAQKPDVALEISEPGQTHVYLFDPKYKLDSEEIAGEDPQARPKKIDIDAMHAYRDAIRGPGAEHVVRYAAILYPGPTNTYTSGLEALRAHPQDPQGLEASIRDALHPALKAGGSAELDSST